MLLRQLCHEDDRRFVHDDSLKCSLIGKNVTSVMNVLGCKQRRGDDFSLPDL
jgi:hypothetical protein